MSKRIRYTYEFKREAVAQVTERGHSVTSVAERIGVSTKSLYDWVKQFGDDPSKNGEDAAEIRRLKAELSCSIIQSAGMLRMECCHPSSSK